MRGWPAGHPKNAETYDIMLKIWEGLRSKADKDNDGQVSGEILFYFIIFLRFPFFLIKSHQFHIYLYYIYMKTEVMFNKL